jgi:AraC-like DNA-binding protein
MSATIIEQEMTKIPDPEFTQLPMIRQPFRYSNMKFPLSALTVGAGHSIETSSTYYLNNERDTETKNPLMHLSYGIWQYTIAGRGRIDLKTGSRDLLPGSLMIVSTPGPHIYYLPNDSDSWEFVFLIMKGREALRLTRIVETTLGNVLDTGELNETISLLHETLDYFLSIGLEDLYINSCYTYRLFMTLFGEAQGFGVNINNEGRFSALIQFLKDNLHRNISVEEMAKNMNLSRSHFTRLFSEEMNTTPRKYLEDLRLKTAIELLFDEQFNIKKAAASCGFTDDNYFCRLFKKRYGLSPGKYRGDELLYIKLNENNQKSPPPPPPHE